MNIIDNIRFKDLEKIIADKELLQQMVSNKNFRKKYGIIKKFINDLKQYGPMTGVYVDFDTITNHLKCILEVSNDEKNIEKYINYVLENEKHTMPSSHPHIVVDKNYKQLDSLIMGLNIYDNIDEIIKAGYSDRLLELIQNNPNLKFLIGNLKVPIFEDKVWNIVKDNPKFGNTTLLDYFISNSQLNYLIQILNNNGYEGLKYTYENIPNSHYFLEHGIGDKKPTKQFNMNFIKNIDDECLALLYKNAMFSDKRYYTKIFKIADCGNYELIKDVIDIRENVNSGFSFDSISDENITKNIFEAQNSVPKSSMFLYQYMGISNNEIRYIKTFIDSIIRIKWTDEFKNKYSEIIKLVNTVLKAPDDKIIELTKSMDINKREEYQKLIKSCEKEGNILIQNSFSSTLQDRNNQLLNSARHRIETNELGQKIDIFELEGQPFTMLVHVIGNNDMSSNNNYVQEIVDDPSKWESISKGNQHISTSLISEQYMVTYGGFQADRSNKEVVYGFYNISPSDIKMTEVRDLGINRNATTDMTYDMRYRGSELPDINTVAPVDHLIKKTKEQNNLCNWNEIVIPRVDERTGQKRKPDFIVCMDYISEASLRAAAYFNIPIYRINKQAYFSQKNNLENTNGEEINIETPSKSR